MEELSDLGRRAVNDLAQQHGFSASAVMSMLESMSHGGGRMAQFSHPEFGGAGQWMGGMTMISDMFNDELKSRIDRLCVSLSKMMADRRNFADSAHQFSGRPGSTQPGDMTPGGRNLPEHRSEESQGRSTTSGTARSGGWWPANLGQPSTTGSQNNLRYAYFSDARRLVIEADGKTTTYDTGDHQISGVSQQQSSDRSVTFTSQHGTVDVARLPVV